MSRIKIRIMHLTTLPDLNHKVSTPSGVGAPEAALIEITPSMVEAGADFLAAHYLELAEPPDAQLWKRIAGGLLEVSLRSRG